MIENGLNPEDLLGRKFGHHLNFWSMSERKLTQRIDLGDAHQMVLELRPAHDPAKAWGFVGVVISVEDLSASVWLWHRDGDRWAVGKVITIPAEPADPDDLPPALKPFGAVPPLVSDIDLSVDDRWLYVSCWGTGELKQYDVSDPFHPRETARSASAASCGASPTRPRPGTSRSRGGPQMVEISRDGKRVYVTNSLYAAWDEVFYPDGVGAWMAKLDADTDARRAGRRPAVLPARRRLPRAAGAPDPAAGRGRVQRLLLLHRLRRLRPGVDQLRQLENLIRQLDQLPVLVVLFLDHLPLQVGGGLPLEVGAILADHHERRQEDRLERHDHRQQPEGITLDAEDDPDREPQDVEVDERHRPANRVMASAIRFWTLAARAS